MSRTECLTHDELAAFNLGELPPTLLEELANHLERCSLCETLARELDGMSSPLVEAYRRSAQTATMAVPASIPQQVGDYEILEEIGRGGMGVVYRARHRHLQRLVALKMLMGGSFALPDERARFRAEAEAVARLQHPHIVQIYEVGEYDGDVGLPRPYFTLEFVEGGNLAARVSGRPQVPRQAAAWIETLARATHYAHGQGIIHRDLKPGNVLLTADSQPKICDFGVAKLLVNSDLKTQSGMVIGTAEYMAPEQAAGERHVGPAADIYALGAILYTLLTGRPPFQGPSPLHTLEQVRNLEPVTPGRLQPRIPGDLETICLKCLEKAPAKRYANAFDLADDLRRFLGDEPIRARRASAWERTARWIRRHKTLTLSLTAVILSLALATTISVLAAMQKESDRLKARNAESQAVASRNVAEEERDRALRNLYVARTNLVGQVLETPAGLAQVAQLFSDWRGRKLRSDPRGWEWYYYQTLANRSERTLHGHALDVTSAAWSPDGARLASGGHDNTIRIWDAASGKQLASVTAPSGILGLSWRPDGRRLATADYPSRTVSIWDIEAGALLTTLIGHRAYIWSVAWNPDGRRLASADSAGTVIVWDVAKARPLFEIKGKPLSKGSVNWSPDGKRLAAAAPDSTAMIWDGESGKPLLTLSGHKAEVVTVAWSPTGDRVATLSLDLTILIWDGSTGAKLRTISVPHAEDFPGSLSWSPDGRRLAEGRRDLTIEILNAETGERQLLLRGHTGSHISTVCWSPDGSCLASAERGWNGTIKIWKTNAAAERPFLADVRPSGPIVITWSPDSRRLAIPNLDGSVRVWDAVTKASLFTLRGRSAAIRQLAWSPDGKLLAGGDEEGGAYLWDIDGKRLQASQAGDGQKIESLSWSEDSSRLAYGTAKSFVFIWDLTTGSVHNLGNPGMRGVLRSQGDFVAVGLSYRIKIIDARSGEELLAWRNAEVTHNYPQWDPNGMRIASLSDFAVEVRVAATGSIPFPPLAHLRRVERFAWSPNGRQIVTCTEDNNLHLWDAVEGNPILTLPGPARHIAALAWSPDTTRIVALSLDGAITTWDATAGYATERAPTLLPALDTRLDMTPTDLDARRLRAGVHARQSDWISAAADAERLAAGGGPALFQAGWWVADAPATSSASPLLQDSFPSDSDQSPRALQWYISADDPNGYVPLDTDHKSYLTRLYVTRPQTVEARLVVVSDLDARLWLNGEQVEAPNPAILKLSAGWNNVTVRLVERTSSTSALLRHGIGFYLRLLPLEAGD